jgi:hypothetical protein
VRKVKTLKYPLSCDRSHRTCHATVGKRKRSHRVNPGPKLYYKPPMMVLKFGRVIHVGLGDRRWAWWDHRPPCKRIRISVEPIIRRAKRSESETYCVPPRQWQRRRKIGKGCLFRLNEEGEVVFLLHLTRWDRFSEPVFLSAPTARCLYCSQHSLGCIAVGSACTVEVIPLDWSA